MRENLLQFLFGDSIMRESSQSIGAEVVKLFEEAADEETEQLVANKTPLSTALKSLGITNAVEAGVAMCTIKCDSPDQYRKHTALLFDPENLPKLAEKGWVPTRKGDAGMTFELPDFTIGFIELDMLDMPDNKKEVPNAEKLRKDAQKFASTPMDRDDDLNPVKTDDKGSTDRQKGVGDAKDGEKPKGKPKGVGEAKVTEGKHKSGCTCGFCKNKGNIHKRKDSKADAPVDDADDAGPASAKVDEKLMQEYGGYWCNHCKKTVIPESRSGKQCCPRCENPVEYPKSKSLRSREAQKVTESLLEMTSAGGVPAIDMPIGASKGPDKWTSRLERMRKRRGENPRTGKVDPDFST